MKLTITNEMIYKKLETLIKENSKEHTTMIEHQLTTNGKVNLNRWIATTALVLIMALIIV